MDEHFSQSHLIVKSRFHKMSNNNYKLDIKGHICLFVACGYSACSLLQLTVANFPLLKYKF